MKTNAKLRPSWNFIAKKLQCSPAQCKARWSEILNLQILSEYPLPHHRQFSLLLQPPPSSRTFPTLHLRVLYTRVLPLRHLHCWNRRPRSRSLTSMNLLHPLCPRHFRLLMIQTRPVHQLQPRISLPVDLHRSHNFAHYCPLSRGKKRRCAATTKHPSCTLLCPPYSTPCSLLQSPHFTSAI